MTDFPTPGANDVWGQQLIDATTERITSLRTTTLYRSTALALTSGVWTAVAWDTEEEDVLGAWAVGAPSDIVVPAGVTRMRASWTMAFTNSTSGGRYVRLLNTTTSIALAGDIRNGLNESGSTVTTPWIPVTPGHVLRLMVHVNASGISTATPGEWQSGLRATFEWR